MLKLTHRAETMMKYAVAAQPELEVGGFARVESIDGGILLTDILIPPQEVSGAALDLGREGIEWVMLELAKRGETLSQWNCWWHSHSTMGVFFSGTDEKTLGNFASMVAQKWAIGIVTNTKGEFVGRLHSHQPPWALVQDKLDVTRSDDYVEQELLELTSLMMLDVKKEIVTTFGSGIAGYEAWKKSQKKGATHQTPDSPLAKAHKRFDSLTYCDLHERWEGDCPAYHIPPKNHDCLHTPNCGGKGCFAKKDRAEMRRLWIGTHSVPMIDTTTRIDGMSPGLVETLMFRAGGWDFMSSGYIVSPNGTYRVYGDEEFPADLGKVISDLDDSTWMRFQTRLGYLAGLDGVDDDDYFSPSFDTDDNDDVMNPYQMMTGAM